MYLGGNEQSTHKYVSELLGKETIDTNSYGRSDGLRGNFSTNSQVAGRELLTPDEVRMLDNKYAIVFIRGERPVLDLKYDILSHPNIKLGTDGGAPPYAHNLGVLTGGVTIEIIDPEALGDTALSDIPTVDEYFKNEIEAYDEEETEMLCEFLKSMLEEKEKTE